MMSEDEVREAQFPWRAVADTMRESPEWFDDNDYQRGLAEGYASALEMVLRG